MEKKQILKIFKKYIYQDGDILVMYSKRSPGKIADEILRLIEQPEPEIPMKEVKSEHNPDWGIVFRESEPAPVWDKDKVIDFVNWFIHLKRFDVRHELENQEVIDSFLRGDDYRLWWDKEGQPEPVPVSAEEILNTKKGIKKEGILCYIEYHEAIDAMNEFCENLKEQIYALELIEEEAEKQYASQFQSKPTDEEIEKFARTFQLYSPEEQGLIIMAAKAVRDGKIKRVGD